MKQSIEKAMAELNMGREELSSALGMSRPYITKMLTRPQSEKTQAKVIGMIDDLMRSVDDFRQLRDAVGNSPIIIDERDKVIKELNQALEYKDQLLARGEDDLHKQTNRANAYKEENAELLLGVGCYQKSINAHIAKITKCEIENYQLLRQVEVLKRKNKDINYCYSIVCVILTALVIWGFYV